MMTIPRVTSFGTRSVSRFALRLLVRILLGTTTVMCGCESRYITLSEFYIATGGSSGTWFNVNGWGNLSACADGFGVTCNGSDVTGLSLNANGLTGS